MDNILELFKPQAKTIKQVFGDVDSYYQIPDYQRPYSWKTEQIEDLWQDVYSAMKKGRDTYFLGAIILTKHEDGFFEVVDGQQRLTTLTILLCVLRDLYLKKDKVLNDLVRSWVEDKYRLRLITQSNYQNRFEKEILEKVKFPEARQNKKEQEKDSLTNAALIFRDKLKDLRTKEKIHEFLDYLMNHVIVITITCADQSSAIRLFQVLNDRGLDLNSTDIIKSYLFGVCAEEKKAQLKADWIKIETIADVSETDTERLITYYGLSILERNPRATLSSELIGDDDFKDRDPTDIVHDLLKFSNAYRKIADENSKLIFSFWYIPNDIYWSTILTTALHVGFVDFNGLAIQLRKLYWSYWIAGYTISKLKQTSFNIIAWVKANKPLSYIEREITKKMKDDKVVGYVKASLDGEVYQERWLKPLLALVEYNKTDDSRITWIEWDKNLQVEHILPEKWSSNPEWKSAWTEEQASQWLHRLGNLTLLSGKKNIVATNDSFKKKKDAYKKGGMTAFETTKEVAGYEDWTEAEAKERHDQLKKEIIEILGI